MAIHTWLPGATIGILITMMLVVLGALALPPKHRDPQYGMAIGCMIFVLIGLAVVLGLYLLARYLEFTWLSRGIEGGVAFVTVLILFNLVAAQIRRFNGR